MSDSLKNASKHLTQMEDGYLQTRLGLMRKRGALSGEIEGLNRELSQRMADLRAIEAALIVLDPDADIDGMPVRRPPNQFGVILGMARFFLTQLRHAPDGMTTKELAEALMRDRHMDVENHQVAKLVQSRCSHSLMKLRLKGVLRSAQNDPSGTLRYWLAG